MKGIGPLVRFSLIAAVCGWAAVTGMDFIEEVMRIRCTENILALAVYFAVPDTAAYFCLERRVTGEVPGGPAAVTLKLVGSWCIVNAVIGLPIAVLAWNGLWFIKQSGYFPGMEYAIYAGTHTLGFAVFIVLVKTLRYLFRAAKGDSHEKE